MNKLFLTIAAVASLFIMSCNSAFKSPEEAFTVKEASDKLKADALMIDVRNPEELEQQAYDVKNIINIPLDSIESKLSAIPKDKLVILACQKGVRSQKAFDLLKEKGFKNIANMEGGMNAWADAGLPVKVAHSEMKACCANPNSKDCNPDGTCKKPAEQAIACCEAKSAEVCKGKTDAKAKTAATSKAAETQVPTASSITKQATRLEVYCFHGTRQCETCINMKANTKATLDKFFAAELKSGEIVFSIIDVDDSKNEKLAEKFQATGTALMINKVVNGKDNISDWSDFAFDKANDAGAFVPELKTKIETVLK